ncbi:MAG: hypothetical protein L6R37_000727 [Teloschistes peruensis]|nr:MAG: hypothetical protein L6R37_000727 [Teloschistes peruensis]
MAGAGKKRAKENRQAEQNSQHGHPAGNDGPSDRPGSSSGPPANPESSRGRAPSNAPSNPPSNAPSQSARGGSRPPSASGPPLRDPAREQPLPPRAELNKRIEWGGNAFDFYASESRQSSVSHNYLSSSLLPKTFLSPTIIHLLLSPTLPSTITPNSFCHWLQGYRYRPLLHTQQVFASIFTQGTASHNTFCWPA